MKIGVFGFGSIGKRHVANLLEMGEKELLVHDPVTLKIGALSSDMLNSPIGVANTTDALWAWKPEAVLICTPPETHHNLAWAALMNGAHVLIEKPIATYLGQAQMLIDAARLEQKHLVVGYQLRWHLWDFYEKASGSDLHFTCAQDMRTWPSQYKKDVLEEFSHEIDAAIFMNGPVETVAARTYGPIWGISLRHQCYVSRIVIHGESDTRVRLASSSHGCTWEFNPYRNDEAYKEELQAFLGICAGGDRGVRSCTGQEAAHVVKIIEACRESAQNCKVVHL